MKVQINKESLTPIRDQLIEQIALQIASGILKGQEKLPSIRALAQRLGIHYSTITSVYNHLSEVGLLEIRQGSGVKVAGKAPNITPPYLPSYHEMFKEFIARLSEAGYSFADLNQCIHDFSKRKPVRRILAVDRNIDFHKLLLAELQPYFDIPVETCIPEEIIKNKNYVTDSLIVTSLYHLFSFKEFIEDSTRLVACNIEPGRNELETVSALPNGSLVVLVSVSSTLLSMTTKLIGALRGEDIAIRPILAQETTELRYAICHAKLVLCDSASENIVMPMAKQTHVIVFHLYAPYTIALIKDRLAKWG